ncbi:TIGR03083 family protein [Pseudonocardia thermophila]|uniref:TIGR03083 family protein n=1 Tax=Pseudonocardia thermophila TaxID=1848 RepID=A0A1M6YKQ5_PSETH|nr:maleylpyruvate isomerase family mycothiol-dependent enzyme [Pseudonocardia thermophila]SHL18846.1 TIGR03083 family protein [Pseudonocardia thermophila]
MAIHPAAAAMRRSHDALAALVPTLTPDQLTGPAYPSEWTVSDTLSHIGSGAVIGLMALDAALSGEPPPDRSAFSAVWDEWNAKDPQSRAVDAVAANAKLTEAWAGVDADRVPGLEFRLGPMQVDGPTMVRMRLGELALHTWDVAVVVDPAAIVEPAAVEQLVDDLGLVASFSGVPVDGVPEVVVATTDPERRFTIGITDSVSLGPAGAGSGAADAVLPAEAFVRLIYGRLDPAHTPAGATGGAVLDRLRTVFRGF